MQRIQHLLILALLIAFGVLLSSMSYKATQQYQDNQTPIDYWDYVHLGQARMTDPIFRMGSMIEIQCQISADFIITIDEKKQLNQIYARLKKHPEKIEPYSLQICDEWEKYKYGAMPLHKDAL